MMSASRRRAIGSPDPRGAEAAGRPWSAPSLYSRAPARTLTQARRAPPRKVL